IAVAAEPPAPLDVDPRLRAVIWKCLEKSPADRYANLGELMAALSPFGGPMARTHLGLAAQLGGASSGFIPAAQPMVPMSSPTQGATTGQSIVVPASPTREVTAPQVKPVRPTGKRNVVLIALLLLVGVGGAAGWMMAFNRPTQVAVVAPDAARVVAAVVIDAAPPIDAAAPVAVLGVNGDPWAVAGQPPIVDAGARPIDAAVVVAPSPPPTTKKSVKRAAGDVWSAIAQTTAMMSDAQWIKQCPNMLHGVGVGMIPLGMRMHCACLTKDQKLAEQLLNAVDADERPGVRAHCKQYGLVLP
ncbi:MAG TPA: hypothetical protein VF403_16880, partial [Kofleriaceae bacterium]